MSMGLDACVYGCIYVYVVSVYCVGACFDEYMFMCMGVHVCAGAYENQRLLIVSSLMAFCLYIVQGF